MINKSCCFEKTYEQEQLVGVSVYDFQFIQINKKEEGFNITIAGQDVRTAFIEEIELQATKNQAEFLIFENAQSYSIDCTGTLRFSKK